MNIVVLGAGRVGFNVAKELSFGEHDVSIIDTSADAIALVSEKLDVKPILGNATDINALKDAGIENADMIIATTSLDEINIVACQIANVVFNVKTRIARISNKAYFDEYQLLEKGGFSIDYVVSPTFEIIKMVRRIISVPGTIDVVSCIENRLRIIGVICKRDSSITNVKLKYIQSVDPKSTVAILVIRRADQWTIPNKDDVILTGDEVYFCCSVENTQNAMELFGYSLEGSYSVVFIGGTEVCKKVVSAISSNNIDIKIIESDLPRAEELSEKLNDVEIIHGDPLNSDVLETSGIRDAEVVISLTNDDRVNILSSLLAKKWGAKRVATVLNDFSYADILSSLGINSILDSRMATVSKILHYIHEGNIDDILSFDDGKIEVVALTVAENSYAVGTLTNDIIAKNEIYISALMRSNQLLLLPKNMLLNAGDKVLFIARKTAIDKLLNLFKEKPKYLL